MKKILFSVALFSFASTAVFGQIKKIKPISSEKVEVKEPSDLIVNPKNPKTLYMVSDHGFLYETDFSGKILNKFKWNGIDTEAVYAEGNKVYAVEEFGRNINIFDADSKKKIRTINVPYNGGRNKAYEAFTFNPKKNVFVLLTEKDPVYLIELDEDFNKINQMKMKKLASDISAATFYNDFLWLLSDEDKMVIKMNPETYEVLMRYEIPVYNPEGIAFTSDGKLLILSDNMQTLYQFENPEN